MRARLEEMAKTKAQTRRASAVKSLRPSPAVSIAGARRDLLIVF